MSETLSFRAHFGPHVRTELEKAVFTDWPTIFEQLVEVGKEVRHIRAKMLRIQVDYKMFFPYRKWLIFKVVSREGQHSNKIEIVELEIHTDHANVPVIKSRVFPERVAGGDEFVGLRYFDAVDIRDHIKQLTGIYFSVQITELVEA